MRCGTQTGGAQLASARAQTGDTALHVAAAAYQVETIRLLVAYGADVAAKNRRGAQPLHCECGADPSVRNRNGSTPMQLALRSTGRGGSGGSVDPSPQRQ
jgi:ankyrin repeat protein